jgi:hypothetical protein
VESVESHRQAFPSFHEPLGNLANVRRDSHIPTAPATKADGKVENQKQVFHFPTATTIERREEKQHARRTGLRPSAGQHKTKGAIRRTVPKPGTSGSSRIGTDHAFQAHLALESILDFRLICGLENADLVRDMDRV